MNPTSDTRYRRFIDFMNRPNPALIKLNKILWPFTIGLMIGVWLND